MVLSQLWKPPTRKISLAITAALVLAVVVIVLSQSEISTDRKNGGSSTLYIRKIEDLDQYELGIVAGGNPRILINDFLGDDAGTTTPSIAMVGSQAGHHMVAIRQQQSNIRSFDSDLAVIDLADGDWIRLQEQNAIAPGEPGYVPNMTVTGTSLPADGVPVSLEIADTCRISGGAVRGAAVVQALVIANHSVLPLDMQLPCVVVTSAMYDPAALFQYPPQLDAFAVSNDLHQLFFALHLTQKSSTLTADPRFVIDFAQETAVFATSTEGFSAISGSQVNSN
jgi:hypothetical protein